MNRFRAFMAGRNGIDQLNIVLLVMALALNFAGRFTGLLIFRLLASITLVYSVFRITSRNLAQRRAENYRFIRFPDYLRQLQRSRQDRRQQLREYRFFTCPDCKNKLRVPRGKGKVQITCPRCGQRFSGRT
jgi:ribosomal protein S27E